MVVNEDGDVVDETHVAMEIASQPECWRRAAEAAATHADVLPHPGERVAVVGCGTSWFVAQSYAALREQQAGAGVTEAFPASEMTRRRYDRVVAITRSGTTTEVLDLVRALRGQVSTVVVTADPASPVVEIADAAVPLPFAD